MPPYATSLPRSFTTIMNVMAEEGLVVPRIRRRRFSAYAGESCPAAQNMLNRNFQASAPNTKWLTDLSEIHIPAGKLYISPIIDCFDGLVVSWTIGTGVRTTDGLNGCSASMKHA